MNDARLYPPLLRLWHVVQAAAIAGLLVTGFAIAAPQAVPLLDFADAVALHRPLGAALLINAAFGLMYHVATGRIGEYRPRLATLGRDVARQALYYVHGMFRGEPNPAHRSAGRKFNPLQRLAYLTILNVALPIQAITGVGLWLGGRVPGAVPGWLHGSGTSIVHGLAAWALASFLVGHLYLITTGHTPLEHVRAMFAGCESVPTAGDGACVSPSSEPRDEADLPHPGAA